MMADMAAFFIYSILAINSSFSRARAIRSPWDGVLAVLVNLLFN